ncbi:transmembrane rhomboid family protein [Rhizobium freirei PRF 81]|uniref:Transmembrane rhomboid family protein n=1 Tax=Rhizobium freirei PRF 81 TaxID=363754 RepID=N6V0A6_9HYPH|nr:rhomboid family intramembrane serine protease [Rhizobium freirei]ENN86436.1 transmembrane rhomboid family protein [Rhizobium freirei PRF 81]
MTEFQFESFTMDTQAPQRMEFAYYKGRVLRFSLILLIFTAGLAAAPFLPERPGQAHPSAIVFLPIAALSGLLMIAMLLKIVKAEPGLAISSAGIFIESYADETIPWRAVRDIRRYKRTRTDQMYVDLDPAVARTLTRRGLARWVPKALRVSEATAVVSLRLLLGNPNWTYDECTDFLAKDREQQALADGGLSPASQVQDHAGPIFNLKGPPIFTYALIAILVGIYIVELKFGVIPSKGDTPDIQTLLVFGGTFRMRIMQYGEWWRLVTASLLHGNFLHLAFNCFALWRAGILLERLIGWRWFAALFCVSAIGGSVASLLINLDNIVGVGASGGIIGLFAAVIVASFHFPSGPLPEILRMGAIQILVPSILPLVAQTAGGMNIDYAAHLGGALAGGIVSLVLLKAWPSKQPHPRFSVAALIGSIGFAIIAAGSIWPISQLRAGYLADPFVQYFQGQYQLAADDFAASAQRDEKAAPYYHLWRFLAQTRGNDSQAASNLRIAASKLDQSKWPYPVYQLFLGELTPAEVTAKASNNDSLCEAIFYVGEWHLLRGQTAEAVPKFNAALFSCPKTFFEYEGAQGELVQLRRH